MAKLVSLLEKQPLPQRQKARNAFEVLMGASGVAAIAITNIFAGAPDIGKEALATGSNPNRAGIAAVKNTLNTKTERMSGSVPERDKSALKQATVRVILDGIEETTGVLVNYKGQLVVMTVAHVDSTDTGSNPFGLKSKDSPPFNGNSRAVDFGLSPGAQNHRLFISQPGSEYTELATIQNRIMGPKDQTGDLMMLIPDSSTITPALKRMKPIPASKFMNTLPAIGTEEYFYGNAASTNRPTEAYAKMLGVATLHSQNQRYIIFGGNWPTNPQNAIGCVARTSGMSATKAGGTVTFSQSAEIYAQKGSTPYGDYADLANQLPGVNTTNSPWLCMVSYPNLLAKTHSSASVFNYFWQGRGYYPGR